MVLQDSALGGHLFCQWVLELKISLDLETGLGITIFFYWED